SASACPAPARSRAALSTSTAATSRRCAAATMSSRRNSNVSSMTTSSKTTAGVDPPSPGDPPSRRDPPSPGEKAPGFGATGSHADAPLLETLHRVWGFSGFRPLQREAMHATLDARDSVVVLPTGGGKSLCFQAPAIVDVAGSERTRPTGADGGRVLLDPPRRGLALVVSPLISLMKDQVDGLRVDGVAAAYLNSTLLPHER